MSPRPRPCHAFSPAQSSIGSQTIIRGSEPLVQPPRLAAAFAAASPRLRDGRTPLVSLLLHAGVAVVCAGVVARTFVANDLFAWSVGLAFVGYDTILVALAVATTWSPRPVRSPQTGARERPTLGVLVAAHDEAAVLPHTIRALLAQSDPPDLVLVVDDGSRDGTAAVLAEDFGLVPPALGQTSAPSPRAPCLRWLRLPHGGKASALNAALLAAEVEIVVTVDADTLLETEAVAALRAAFAASPHLVAATGVLRPICADTPVARALQAFQTLEYARNFQLRCAWARLDCLLLISGAFAGYRRAALLAVGGFDPACLVEDYELTHRLRRYASRHGLAWTSDVVVDARAATDAPASPAGFLRQRRRWFGGFLETQRLYRDMAGDGRYGRVGRLMLPVKALDTMQPIYGLSALALVGLYAVERRLDLLTPIAGILAAKIVVDATFALWSARRLRLPLTPDGALPLAGALGLLLLEPFTFQPLRQAGALWGWIAFLRGDRAWGRTQRRGVPAQSTGADRVSTPDGTFVR